MEDIDSTNVISNQTNADNPPIGIGVVQKIGVGLFLSFALIGIISNICLCQIYRKKDLKLRFNCLMLSLALFDLVTILLFVLTAILQLAYGPNAILLFVDGAFLNCSAYTMTVIALERYLALCCDK